MKLLKLGQESISLHKIVSSHFVQEMPPAPPFFSLSPSLVLSLLLKSQKFYPSPLSFACDRGFFVIVFTTIALSASLASLYCSCCLKLSQK